MKQITKNQLEKSEEKFSSESNISSQLAVLGVEQNKNYSAHRTGVTNYYASLTVPNILSGVNVQLNKTLKGSNSVQNSLLQAIIEQNESMSMVILELNKTLLRINNNNSDHFSNNEEIPFKLRNRKHENVEVEKVNGFKSENESIGSKEKRPRILVYGYSFLNSSGVVSVISNVLSDVYGIEILPSDIKVLVSNNSKKLKNNSPASSLQKGKYDYMIAGPHPHSVKGKNIKHQWNTFLSFRKIPTTVFELYNKALTKSYINELAHKIGKDWHSKVSETSTNNNY